ncbi:hypothetical protein BpHYR1_009806 [Brachionus plicatilis]|uniref:Uncharacterized protein n=1 Tax=Brachionus plicatilis TaxID=10195 RepID=A0A3M7SZF1_BRAPC|nr:hypothetical protein BpHYR1_009806 [Brachionus plicatilis]
MDLTESSTSVLNQETMVVNSPNENEPEKRKRGRSKKKLLVRNYQKKVEITPTCFVFIDKIFFVIIIYGNLV